jgi:hypothetical protein
MQPAAAETQYAHSGIDGPGFELAFEYDSIRRDTATRDAPFRPHRPRGRALYEALSAQATGLRKLGGVAYFDCKASVVRIGPAPLPAREVVNGARKGDQDAPDEVVQILGALLELSVDAQGGQLVRGLTSPLDPVKRVSCLAAHRLLLRQELQHPIVSGNRIPGAGQYRLTEQFLILGGERLKIGSVDLSLGNLALYL